jgi:uncharacterized protein YbjT (DUF2867 family)
MARALIVGCGCRGRLLGGALQEAGWVVRGTSRTKAGAGAIEAAGIEAAIADPGRIATVLDAIDGVSLIYWLLGTVPEADLHGPRLERLLEEIVDTPVRALIYELSEELEPAAAAGAFEALRSANETWRIPFEVVAADYGSPEWLEGMLAAARELVG